MCVCTKERDGEMQRGGEGERQDEEKGGEGSQMYGFLNEVQDAGKAI